ncbi:uncharacterized protein LOC132243758 [Alligator mississippiensis]|uniref:uncharacterized protein LOC132243758 n=1 Tax=Alligator mississippiensis TaxID=8496 RepID=UPI002877B1F3|nr:uncharacterized protein LOC132243758 [Alligator mississippiensis]
MQRRRDGQRLLRELLTLQAAVQQRGHEAVELQGWKVSVPEKIVELMEDVSREEDLANATPDIIAAIWCLSDWETCLDPFLQSRLLRAAACKTFGAVEHNNISNLRMHMGNLEGLLWCLLSSAPSLDRLNFLWEVSRMQRGWAQGRPASIPVICTSLSQHQLWTVHGRSCPPSSGDLGPSLALPRAVWHLRPALAVVEQRQCPLHLHCLWQLIAGPRSQA